MELYVFNRDIELLGVIDNFDSLIWTRKFYKAGEFQLTLSTDFLPILQTGNLICKKNYDEAGYIISRNISLKEDGSEVLTIKGKFITNYLSQRINWGILNFNGTVEDLSRKLVDDNCISSSPSRVIPGLELSSKKGFTEELRYQNSYGYIDEELTSLAETYGISYRINLDYINKKLIFENYKGVNRTTSQSSIAPCIFSRDFENVLTQEYFESQQDFKNVALVAGEGEGSSRTLVSINSNIGLDRYELFVDARELRKDDGSVSLTDEEYKNVLINKGKNTLAEYKEIKTFESTINTNSNNVYKVDYDLGDIVTMHDKSWNITIDTQITEVQEIYENGYVSIVPTFGNNIPTILDKLKKVR